MTNKQRLQLFGAMCRYQLALLELRENGKNSQLDMKPYFEPVIDKMLAEARAEGEAAATSRLIPKP
jgi:hypothetical protein